VSDESEKIRKEAAVASVEALSRKFRAGTEEKHETRVRVVGVSAEIRTRHTQTAGS
jgi:hypothetical protein